MKKTAFAKKKRIVYTALIGEYESFSGNDIELGDDTDLVCFTDSPNLVNSQWTFKLIKPRFPNDSIRSARYLKVMGPTLLSDYEESLWVDNTVLLTKPTDMLFDNFLSNVDFALPFHSFRESVSAEFHAVDSAGYDDPTRIYEQLMHYAQTRPDVLEEKPFWTAILLRKHTPEMQGLMQVWWEHILRYSRRDQLSLNYALKDFSLRLNALDIDNYTSNFHQWPVNTKRNRKLTKSATAIDALRTVPIAKMGALQNTVDVLKRELASLKSVNKEVSDKPEQKKLPADLLSIVIDQLASKKSLKVAQVGVCDGVINDPIYNTVMKNRGKTNMLLIEPQTFLMPIIKENYATHPSAQIVNCAIGGPGTLKLYRLKDEYIEQLKRTYLVNSPSYRVPAGFVSSDVNHVLKHIKGKLPENINPLDAVEGFEIESKSLSDVMADVDWDGIDVLQIDTEGMDDVTLSYCDVSKYKPTVINYEHFHLTKDRREAMELYLETLGYKLYHYSNSDTMATTLDIKVN